MVKSARILLQILLASTAVLANSIHSDAANKDLMYIGNCDENHYFISVNSATWNNADADCRNQLGSNGHLVSIESEEEWGCLATALESDRYGLFMSPHWTSGKFDPLRSVWRWTENDRPFGPFPPWRFDHPRDSNEPVLISYISRSMAYLLTAPSSHLHRYICEMT